MDKPQVVEKPRLTLVDARIVVSVLICAATATLMNHFGLVKQMGEGQRPLEIIQLMTACISCLLLCQDNTDLSFKAGLNRLIITFVGGVVGVLVALINTNLPNPVLMVAMIGVGVLLTLFLCKVCRVPAFQARIGGVTFILVSCTLQGYARIWYSLFRFTSTLYAALVVLLVTWIFSLFAKKKA